MLPTHHYATPFFLGRLLAHQPLLLAAEPSALLRACLLPGHSAWAEPPAWPFPPAACRPEDPFGPWACRVAGPQQLQGQSPMPLLPLAGPLLGPGTCQSASPQQPQDQPQMPPDGYLPHPCTRLRACSQQPQPLAPMPLTPHGGLLCGSHAQPGLVGVVQAPPR